MISTGRCYVPHNQSYTRCLQKMPILAKKNHLFRWSSFWSRRVCKQVKLSHLGHRKPACIHWKAVAPKTSHCLMWILVQRYNWAIFLRKWARRGRYSQWRSLLGHVERIFVHKISRRRILATFSFNRTTLRATQPKLHSMFCARFWVAIWHRWTIICGVPAKISVTPTSQRQLTL